MAAIAGAKGSIKVGATPSVVTDMNSWKLTIKNNLEDTTSFDDNGWESSQATVKAWEGSIEGSWNMDDTTGQKALQAALIAGTPIAMELFTDKADIAAAYEGNALIESLEVDTSVKGIIKVSIKFKGTGALTPAV